MRLQKILMECASTMVLAKLEGYLYPVLTNDHIANTLDQPFINNKVPLPIFRIHFLGQIGLRVFVDHNSLTTTSFT